MIPPVLVSELQLVEASPSSPTPLPHTLTGTDAETPSALTSVPPDPSLGVEPPPPPEGPPVRPVPEGPPVPPVPPLPPLPACWPVPQLAELSPRAATPLPQTVSGADADTLPMRASTWLPEPQGRPRDGPRWWPADGPRWWPADEPRWWRTRTRRGAGCPNCTRSNINLQ
jgi:hypothetical protein